MTGARDSIWVWIHGEGLLLRQRNARPAKCKICGAQLQTGEGFRRQMDAHLLGTGYLCRACVAGEIRSKPTYAYNRLTDCLSPFTALYHSYGIPAETLAQAWEQGGAEALKVAAEHGREAARKAWLEERDIPYVPDRY